MPTVSVIVPCYNEQWTIGLLLDALYAQTFPRAEMEVIIADGRSQDGTRAAITAFQRAHTDLCVYIVDNPDRTIPAALNHALAAAAGEFIVRLDAHSMPRPDYVARCLAALQAGSGDNVGGVWDIPPRTPRWAARSIAAAAAHPLGVGDALYRYAERPQAVDTVPFGAFRRTLIADIGPFDETLLTNEDYEFNTRVRLAGGRVWLDPAIRSTYFARASFGALARQYWRYGFWKLRMLRRYPQSIRWRQAAPPLFVFLLLLLGLLAIFFPAARILLSLQLGFYAALLLAAGVYSAWRRRTADLALGVALAIAVMHLSWGAGFLWSLVSSAFPGRAA